MQQQKLIKCLNYASKGLQTEPSWQAWTHGLGAAQHQACRVVLPQQCALVLLLPCSLHMLLHLGLPLLLVVLFTAPQQATTEVPNIKQVHSQLLDLQELAILVAVPHVMKYLALPTISTSTVLVHTLGTA